MHVKDMGRGPGEVNQWSGSLAPEGRIELTLIALKPHLGFILTNSSVSGAVAAAREKPDAISIKQRVGIWRVSLNGEFYGDYTRRYWALQAAFEKADELSARGRETVIASAMDGQQDVVLYDTRRPARRDTVEDAFKARFDTRRSWPPLVGESFAKRLLAQARA